MGVQELGVSSEGVTVKDFDGSFVRWIETQLHLQAPQAQIHLVELFVQHYNAVFPYPPGFAHEEETVQFQGRIGTAQVLTVGVEAIGRRLSGRAVSAAVIEALQPHAQLSVELFQGMRGGLKRAERLQNPVELS